MKTFYFCKNGDPRRTRTFDPMVKSHLLYRLSYRTTFEKSLPVLMQASETLDFRESRAENQVEKGTFLLKPAFHCRIRQYYRLVALGSGRDQTNFDAD